MAATKKTITKTAPARSPKAKPAKPSPKTAGAKKVSPKKHG
jgi:hypothetical protein